MNPPAPSAALSIAMISLHSGPLGPLGASRTGGLSVCLRALARELGRAGHRVDLFAPPPGDAHGEEPIPLGPNVRLFPVAAGISRSPHDLHRGAEGILEAIERLRGRAAARYDLVHSHYWASGRTAELACRAWGVPHVLTLHTLAAAKRRLRGGGQERFFRLEAERRLAAACDALIVPSPQEKEILLRFCPAAADRTAVVPWGVDFEGFRPVPRREARWRLGIPQASEVVLYVGRVVPEKGLKRLFSALAHLRDRKRLRLLVVGGDGAEDPRLRLLAAQARIHGLENRVTFCGRAETEALPLFYSAADLLALPSSYESFGLVVLEALACGTPVAATPVGAAEFLLRDGKRGRLASGFAPADLARAIADLLDTHLPSPFMAEALRRSIAGLDWKRTAAGVLAVYRALLSGRGINATAEAGKSLCCGCGLGWGHR